MPADVVIWLFWIDADDGVNAMPLAVCVNAKVL
jgi:hypothetical protein